MRELAIRETVKNNYNLVTNLSRPTVSYIHQDANTEYKDVADIEYNIFKGIQVHKKSCIYKRPIYNEGSWVDQFNKILPYELENQFNIKTKARDNQKPTNLLA
jgi:hypothetical protein